MFDCKARTLSAADATAVLYRRRGRCRASFDCRTASARKVSTTSSSYRPSFAPNVDRLFPGLEVDGCYQFRITRNSNLYVDDEEVSDLVRALEGQLEASRYGAAVRIEIGHDCPDDLREFLLDHFQLTPDDMYLVDGPVNLNRLATICDIDDRPDLLYPPFTQGLPDELQTNANIFDVLDKKNVLLHHPYQSFMPVIDFIGTAAQDPDVLAIKQTLYRTGADSPVVDHLVSAARSGKEVTVIIELMARFDEAANIALANRLQEAGAHVVYGLVGFKTHAKMLMVVRRRKQTSSIATFTWVPATIIMPPPLSIPTTAI